MTERQGNCSKFQRGNFKYGSSRCFYGRRKVKTEGGKIICNLEFEEKFVYMTEEVETSFQGKGKVSGKEGKRRRENNLSPRPLILH